MHERVYGSTRAVHRARSPLRGERRYAEDSVSRTKSSRVAAPPVSVEGPGQMRCRGAGHRSDWPGQEVRGGFGMSGGVGGESGCEDLSVRKEVQTYRSLGSVLHARSPSSPVPLPSQTHLSCTFGDKERVEGFRNERGATDSGGAEVGVPWVCDENEGGAQQQHWDGPAARNALDGAGKRGQG
jgi:hypothetical protein